MNYQINKSRIPDYRMNTSPSPDPGSGCLTGAEQRCGESPSKIRDAACLTEQHLSELHETISTLTARLETVLTPEPPQPNEKALTSIPIHPASHFLARVHEHNERLTVAIMRLRTLADRVEV